MNENEHSDHLRLRGLLQQAKLLLLPMSDNQQKKWVGESPLRKFLQFSRSILSIMPSSALSSAEFFLNQRANRPNYLLTPTMPDRRFKLRVSKKARRCHHAFNAHHLKKTLQGWAHPCFYPGCDCKDYRPEKRK